MSSTTRIARSARPILRTLQSQQCRPLTTSTPRLDTFSTVPKSSESSSAPSSQTSSAPHSTIDPTELSHFSTLASTWWAPHGSSRLLHLMNPLRLQFLSTLPKATTGPNSTTYLDVGCGGGILSESLARLPTTRSVTGLEPGPEVFKIALSHARTDPLFHPSKGKLRYLNMSVEAFSAAAPESVGLQAQEDKKVDIVTLMEVLEHTPTPRELLGTLFPLVKPGGWLALSTISRTVTSYLTTKLVAEDLLRIVPRGTHDWGKYLRPEEVVGIVRGLGEMGEVRVRGCGFVPGKGWVWMGPEKVVGEGRSAESAGVGGWGLEGVGNYFVAVRKMEK